MRIPVGGVLMRGCVALVLLATIATGLNVRYFSTSYGSACKYFRAPGLRTPLYLKNPFATWGTDSARSPRRSDALRLKMSTENPYYKGMDAYQILDVPRTADKKAIKAAYRKAVATWHPDKFPDNEEKKKEGNLRMEKINRAWFCLGDDDRKARYDQYGEEGVGTSAASEDQLKAAGGPGMSGFGGMNGDMGDLSDIFDAFFGGGASMGGRGRGGGGGGGGGARAAKQRANAPIPGDDVNVEADVPFMTSVFGGQEKVRVRRLEDCKACAGTGVKPGAKVKTCSTCGGQGAVNTVQRTPFGVFSNVATCPACQGTGQEVEEHCGSCRGQGQTAETKEVTIKIPAGVESGSTMRLRDGGHAGKRGGARGDLYIQINVRKDPKFRREGTDIHTTEEISYIQAILGTALQADTVDGPMEIKVPAGTQPEQKLRLKGKGVPRLNNANMRGDAYITVKVKIPAQISAQERELLEKLSTMNEKGTHTSSGKPDVDNSVSIP